MNVAFYLTFRPDSDCLNYVLADMLVRSVRQHLPNVPITQFTDENSPAVYGIDRVARKKDAPLPMLRSAHYADVSGDWLFLDTDIVIRGDVAHVFDSHFDVAVCDRNWAHLPPTPDNLGKFNAGVVFSKNQKFWAAVHDYVKSNPQLHDDWFGDQKAIASIAGGTEFKVTILPGMKYNYPPASETDKADGALVVHCKGDRKRWMLSRFNDAV